MTTPTVVRAGLFALAIVALSFVPGVSSANSLSAKGKGDFMFQGNVRIFSFHAITHDNGRVTGKAELQIPATGVVVRMTIDSLCFFPPNTVFVGGTITQSNVPNVPVGQTVIFEAQDNGKGKDSPPDRLSRLFPFPPVTDCNTLSGVDLGPIDLQHGDIKIKVRPEEEGRQEEEGQK
ncbi:MAG TPA: hypothetical protein VE201_06615 [Nitrospirales bacterium]|nr:hypothetical protein [Nitrospirales bacterium]